MSFERVCRQRDLHGSFWESMSMARTWTASKFPLKGWRASLAQLSWCRSVEPERKRTGTPVACWAWRARRGIGGAWPLRQARRAGGRVANLSTGAVGLRGFLQDVQRHRGFGLEGQERLQLREGGGDAVALGSRVDKEPGVLAEDERLKAPWRALASQTPRIEPGTVCVHCPRGDRGHGTPPFARRRRGGARRGWR